MLANIRDGSARQPPGPPKRLALALCTTSLACAFTGCSGRRGLVLHDLRLGLVRRLLRQAEVSVRAFLDRLHTARAGYGCAAMTESHVSNTNSQELEQSKVCAAGLSESYEGVRACRPAPHWQFQGRRALQLPPGPRSRLLAQPAARRVACRAPSAGRG